MIFFSFCRLKYTMLQISMYNIQGVPRNDHMNVTANKATRFTHMRDVLLVLTFEGARYFCNNQYGYPCKSQNRHNIVRTELYLRFVVSQDTLYKKKKVSTFNRKTKTWSKVFKASIFRILDFIIFFIFLFQLIKYFPVKGPHPLANLLQMSRGNQPKTCLIQFIALCRKKIKQRTIVLLSLTYSTLPSPKENKFSSWNEKEGQNREITEKRKEREKKKWK